MISIIIPTYNRNDLLSKCLDCLKSENQQINKYTYEVIVTDDSQENIARDLIENHFNWVNWLEGPKRGPAANRNNGASKAIGEWLLFIDDDCLPDKMIIQEYTNSIRNNNKVLVFEGLIKSNGFQRRFDEECPINITGGYLWSCNFMIEKNLFFEKLGGFDDKFPYAAMEDVDMHYRLNKLGTTIIFLPQALVVHPWRIQKNLFRTNLNRFKSTLYFLDKHPEKNSEINSFFYIKVVYMDLLKNGLLKIPKYGFKGFTSIFVKSSMSLFFSIYLIFRNNIK